MKLFKRKPKDDELFNKEAMEAIAFRSRARSLTLRVVLKEVRPDGAQLDSTILEDTMANIIYRMELALGDSKDEKSMLIMPGHNEPYTYQYIHSSSPTFLDILFKSNTNGN